MLSSTLHRLALAAALAAAPEVKAASDGPVPRSSDSFPGLAGLGSPERFQKPDSLQALASLTGTPMPIFRREECLFQVGKNEAANIRLPRTMSDFLGTPVIPNERFRVESAGETYAAILTDRGYLVTAGSPFVLTDDSRPAYWILSAAGNQMKPSDLSAALYSDTLFMRARLSEEFRSIVVHFKNDYARFNLEAETGKPLRMDGILSTSFGEFDVRYQKGDGGQFYYTLERDDARFQIGCIYPNSRMWQVKGTLSIETFEGWVTYQHATRNLNVGAKAQFDGGHFSVLADATLDRQCPRYSISIALEFELGPRIISRPRPILDW